MHIFYAVVISAIGGFVLGLVFGQTLKTDAQQELEKAKKELAVLRAKVRAKV